MADQKRATQVALETELERAPHKFSFYQLIRRLECAYPHKPRLGRSQRPTDDAIRLGQEVSLSFESASLTGFIPSKNGLPARVLGRFFGLFGTNGALPLHLTEYARERILHHKDHTLARFVDIFHHRMMSLFYRAWADTQPTVSLDRPDEDRFANYLGAFAGVGMEPMQARDAMPDFAKLHYMGYLSCQNKHGEGLRKILADYFGLPVVIEEMVGDWLTIESTDLTCLSARTGANQLGVSSVLGGRVWSCQHKFRIRMGPLSLPQYLSLLPSGQASEVLIGMVRNYIGDELDWDVNLVLQKAQVPVAKLGAQSALGWTSWLGGRQTAQDADDLKLNILRKAN